MFRRPKSREMWDALMPYYGSTAKVGEAMRSRRVMEAEVSADDCRMVGREVSVVG